MATLRLSITFLLWYAFTAVYCQEQLDITPAKSCFYSTKEYPEEFYSFGQDSSIEALKNEIVRVTKAPDNFILQSANVETVAAIVDKTTRYVLYSRRYFNTIPTIDKTLLIAHAIGHHAYKHDFVAELDKDEDIEADEFAGFALSLLGYTLDEVVQSAARLSLKDTESATRLLSIESGFKRGEVLLKNGKHAAFSEKEINDVLKNMPIFPIPPPIPSAEINLNGYFSSCKTLGQVDKTILDALNSTGYFSKKYYYTEGGYALVTKMEQFNKDGSCKQGNARWSARPIRNEDFSVTNYLKSLFIPDAGFFRVIVFVVRPNYYGNNSGKKTDKEGVMAWLENGYTSLPSVIGGQPFNGKMQTHALIYEFKVLETNKQFIFSKPSDLDGNTHLRMAKILENLKKR